MIRCSECDSEISSEAMSCPNCGAPGLPGLRAKSNRTALIILCVVAVLGALMAFNIHQSNQKYDQEIQHNVDCSLDFSDC